MRRCGALFLRARLERSGQQWNRVARRAARDVLATDASERESTTRANARVSEHARRRVVSMSARDDTRTLARLERSRIGRADYGPG